MLRCLGALPSRAIEVLPIMGTVNGTIFVRLVKAVCDFIYSIWGWLLGRWKFIDANYLFLHMELSKPFIILFSFTIFKRCNTACLQCHVEFWLKMLECNIVLQRDPSSPRPASTPPPPHPSLLSGYTFYALEHIQWSFTIKMILSNALGYLYNSTAAEVVIKIYVSMFLITSV